MTRKLFTGGVLILAVLGLAGVQAATWVPLNGAQAFAAAPQVQVLRSDYTAVQFRIDVPGFSFETTPTKGGDFTSLSLGEEGYTTQVGFPKLPVIRRMVEIPFGAQISLVTGNMVVRQGTLAEYGMTRRIIPVQAPVVKMPGALEAAPFDLDQAAYARAGYTIGQFARIVEEGQMRGHRFVLVEIFPFDYSPSDGRVMIVSSMDVTLQLTGSNKGLTRRIKERYGDPAIDNLARRTFINPGFAQEDLVTLPLGMLIITNNHYASLPVMNTFTTWKHDKGYHVTVATVENIGTTTTAIKAYIQNAYDTWAIPPDYVLLIGDVDMIPNWVGSGSGSPATDLYYATLAGSDYFADVGIGRLSPSNDTNFGLMISKTLQYEQCGWSGDLWEKRAVFMASNDNYTVSEGTHNFVISTYLDPDGYQSTKLYCHTYGATTQQVTDNINTGRSLAVYSGHGDVTYWADGPVFNQSNVNALTNTVYPYVCSHACLTGQYPSSECFGETWIRTQNGTFAFWGSTTYTYWDEDDILERKMFEAFFNEQSPQQDQNLTWIAGMTDYAKMGVYTYYGGGGLSKAYWEQYNLLGDPSVDIWTHSPYNVTVTLPGAVLIGQPTLTVNVTGFSDWAMVNVYSSAENLMFTQYVSTPGPVTFNLGGGFTLPGTLHVWVTGHDVHPYHGTNQIIPPSGPYVIYNSSQINDATIGNNNGQWDFGETTDLNVRLKNVGIAAANNVNAILSEADPLVTVIDSTAAYGTINAGDSVMVNGAFQVQAAGNTPDQHTALFTVTATASNGGPWTSNFVLTINSPVITKDTLVIQDPAPGNNNGALDPGETATFALTMINNGHMAAQNVAVAMSSNNSQITITGNPGNFGNMAVHATATDTWTVAAASSIQPGTVVRFTLNITADGGYASSESFDLVVGDLRNMPSGPDAYGYKAWDNLDGGESHPYNWIEISPRLGGPGTGITWTQDDQTFTYNLPFPFRYYGQTFNQVSICNNGWIAMGATTSTDYSNTGIPDPDGPPNMIAPYWHDLSPQLGGQVSYYYNASQHYYVVEYDTVRHYSPTTSRETFEIVLYDPAYYGTSTGDGIIEFQYKLVTDGGQGTVGIENQAQTVGLQYGYNGTWDIHAWPTQAGRAITFTTNVAGATPNLDVTLTPINPPLIIPANGGSFQFTANVVNNGPSQTAFTVWSRDRFPDGSYSANLMGPVQINPPVGQQVTRIRLQNVPGTWPPGQHTYMGYANTSVAYPAIDSSFFTWTKSTTADGGPEVTSWACTGELFDGEIPAASDLPTSYSLAQCHPNPFNPVTAISYQLQATSQVKLTVWDTAGRLVATLVDRQQNAGTYQVSFDGSKLSSGLYFYRLQAGSFTAVRKMMLVK